MYYIINRHTRETIAKTQNLEAAFSIIGAMQFAIAYEKLAIIGDYIDGEIVCGYRAPIYEYMRRREPHNSGLYFWEDCKKINQRSSI
jgi:hypothetical protein